MMIHAENVLLSLAVEHEKILRGRLTKKLNQMRKQSSELAQRIMSADEAAAHEDLEISPHLLGEWAAELSNMAKEWDQYSE